MTEKRHDTLYRLAKTIKLFRYLGISFILIGIYGTVSLAKDLHLFSASSIDVHKTIENHFDSSGQFSPDTSSEIPNQIKQSFRKYGTKPFKEVNAADSQLKYFPEFQPKLLSLNQTYDTMMIAGINGVILPITVTSALKGPMVVLVGFYKDFDLFSIIKNRVFLKFLFVDSYGKYVGHVYNNQIYINPTYNLGMAYDDSGFEVIDTYGNIIFTFYIAGPRQLFLQGYLYDPIKRLIDVYGPNGFKQLPISSTPDEIALAQKEVCHHALYRYPSNLNFNTRYPDSLMPHMHMSERPRAF